MTEHKVTEQQGWSGIADALARAAPGDTVLVGAGRYTGGDTLRVGSDVTLAGEADAVLAYAGERAAVIAHGVQNVVIRSLTVEGYDRLNASPGEEGSDDVLPIGLIELNEIEGAVVENCTVRAGAQRRSGIAVSRSRAVTVSQNTSRGARRGISFWSSSGSIENNCCSNGRTGIQVARHADSSAIRSEAGIRGNRCHDNGDGGIVLFSSVSAGIEENDCWGNGNGGIVLLRDPASPDALSEALIRGNRCHDNRDSAGIVLSSSISAGIEDNECWGNGNGGITLQRDAGSPDAPSEAPIRSNRCYDNTGVGIALSSSSSSGIEDNECWGNGSGGIVLLRDPDSPDAPSEAPIRRNRCYDNTGVGVALSSSSSSGIEDNECWGNGNGGIVLQRAPGSPDAPSEAPIRGNRCHDDRDGAGIVLFSSISSGIENNDCWGNGSGGIALQLDADSLDAPSDASIRGNRCHDNAGAGIAMSSSSSSGIEDNECWGNGNGGIVLFSSISVGIEDNECWENGNGGIVLQRDPVSPNAPSEAPIRRNRCHDDREGAGIVLFSSISACIEGNECWGNGNGGIVLQRDSDSPDASSEAPIRGNRCHDDREGAGIVLFSSISACIEGNECWGNGNGGIVLRRDPVSPSAPSEAPIRGNRCHDDREGGGIVLFSSISAGIEDNECWGNGNGGISLQREPGSPEAPSEAPIRGNRCHDDREGAGIVLFSSISACIEGNECWGNGNGGIVLQRDSDSPDASSEAPIRGNRCHDDREGAGIVLFSSISACIEGNECWGNGNGGIVLRRDPVSPSAPSEAPIRGNRCHDDREGGGIVLFSSISAGIEDNECWGNGNGGISLQREPGSPEAPSEAPIRGNRCHDDREGAGIVLLSSISAGIENNECWGNRGSGISLQRVTDSPDAPSEAPIRGNRCHDNREGAGIALFSSISAGIEDNECWGNGSGGIVLQRSANSPDAPSEAPIRGNRCHDDRGSAGIALFSSISAGIEENDCWGNGSGGILLQRDPKVPDAPSKAPVRSNRCRQHSGGSGIQVIASEALIEQNICFDNAFDYLPPSLAPNTVKLAIRGVSTLLMQSVASTCGDIDGAEHLADFLASSCPECLRRFLLLASIKSEEKPRTIADAPVTIYKISQAKDAETLVSAELQPGAKRAADALIAVMVPLASERSPRAIATATLVSCDEGDTAMFADRVAAIAAKAADRELSPGVGDDGLIVRLLRKQRRRVGAVIRLKLDRRNLDQSQPANLAGMLERALLSGTSPTLQRLTALGTSPLVLSVIAVVALALIAFPAQSLGFIKEWFSDVFDPSKGILVRFLKALAIPSSISGGIIVVQSALPETLRFRVFGLDAWRERAHPALTARLVAAADVAAQRSLVRRRLFGRRAIAVLALEGVDAWEPDDLKTLGDVLAIRARTTTRLLLVVQTDERSLVRPLILEPIADAPWKDGLTLVLADDPATVTLKPLPDDALSEKDAQVLLGATDVETNALRNALRAKTFAPLDLVPALAIGSAPTARFSVARSNSGEEDWVGHIRELLQGFDVVFDGRLSHDIRIGAQSYEKLEAAVRPSDLGTWFVSASPKDTDRIHLIGRVGRRRDAVRLVRHLFGERDPKEVVDYVSQAGACGYLNLLRELRRLIDSIDERDAVNRLRRGFDGLVFLSSEISWRSIPPEGRDIIEQAWLSVEDGMRSLPVGEDGQTLTRAYTAFLSARYLRLVAEEDNRAEAFIAPVVAALERVTDGHLVATSAADVAIRLHHTRLRTISRLEPARGSDIARRWLNESWPSAPKAVAALYERVAASGMTLAMALITAPSVDDVKTLIEIYRDEPARLAFLIGGLAGHRSRTAVVADAPATASLLLSLRSVAARQGVLGFVVADEERDALAVHGYRSAAVAAFASTPDSAAWLDCTLAEPKTTPLNIEGISDNELDRTIALADRLAHLRTSLLGHPVRAKA